MARFKTFGHLRVVSRLPVRTYRRYQDKFTIKEEGRWGPLWLHRLVLIIVRNLGMLGHPVFTHDSIEVREVDIGISEDNARQIENAVHALAEQGEDPEMYIALIGNRQMDLLNTVEGGRYRVDYFSEHREDPKGFIGFPMRNYIRYGIEHIAVPNFDGVMVVHREQLVDVLTK